MGKKGIGYHQSRPWYNYWDDWSRGESIRFENSISLYNGILKVNGYDFSYAIDMRTYNNKEEESYE